MRILILTVCLAFLTACPSSGESTYHCDFRTATTGQEDRCQERSVDALVGATSEQSFLDTCDTSQGVSSSGPCGTDGIVGGCLYDDNGGLETVTDWYYTPMTLADVEAECAGEGTVVQP